ncbi:MAG: transcriptional regulator NrdR [candidate division Zixibacteria bacterium 4484_93]|nr:MAG: transcriptional regulator NrdR [candidate division Zixibacteria bacterium 4484_93]
MRCPYCGHEEDKVVDTRPVKDGMGIRRRRECLSCHKRFTTYEYIYTIELMVVKNDGRIEPYDREKLFNGLAAACHKRPISMKRLEAVVDEIEEEIMSRPGREVASKSIGELVMEKLKELDEVAYIRFASVYRKFKDINEFMQSLKSLLDEQ